MGTLDSQNDAKRVNGADIKMVIQWKLNLHKPYIDNHAEHFAWQYAAAVTGLTIATDA